MTALAQQIERRLEQTAGLSIAVEEEGDRIILTGLVDSDALRQAAYDIVTEIAPNRSIDDNLEVMDAMPGGLAGVEPAPDASPGMAGISLPDLAENEPLEPGDFAGQALNTDPLAPIGASYEQLGPDLAAEGDLVYVPPMDPAGEPAEDDTISTLQMSALDTVEVDRSVSDGRLSDDAIGVAVARVLAEDSATTDLDITVTVKGGVVRLRGCVPTLDDAENAEAVAAEVPGAAEVQEDLEVADLGGRP